MTHCCGVSRAGKHLPKSKKPLKGDIMKPVTWMLPDLLKAGLRCLYYEGQFDLRDGPAQVRKLVPLVERGSTDGRGCGLCCVMLNIVNKPFVHTRWSLQTYQWLEALEWEGKKEFFDAPRRPWYMDGRLGGFARQYGNLADVIVAGAGHLVPFDQPKRSLEVTTLSFSSFVLRNLSIHLLVFD